MTLESRLGVAEERTGLPCRVPHGCPQRFTAHVWPQDSRDALLAATLARNAHEHEAHQYLHVGQSIPPAWNIRGLNARRRPKVT